MNDLQDFRARWDKMRAEWGGKPDKFECLPPSDYSFLRDDERRLLQEIGLPQSGPAFSYDELSEGMPRVDELYGMNNESDREYWAEIDREQIARFRMMGQDGGGNPVVLDVESREILILDHEAMFKPFDLVSSSLVQFMELLIVMQRANADAPDVDVEKIRNQIEAIDPQVTEKRGYWHTYAEDLTDFN